MNKKLFFAFAALGALTLFTCCQRQKVQTEPVEELVFMELSKKDTTDVLNLVNNYLDHLRQDRVDEAMAMLYVLNGDSLAAVPAHLAKKQKLGMRAFHPIRYEVEHIKFRDEKDCEVRYASILFDKPEGDNSPNKIYSVLKPVRREGVWYLTIADSEDDNTIESRIREQQ